MESTSLTNPTFPPSGAVLLQPTFRGRAVTVAIATEVELAALTGVAMGEVRDELQPWCLIAVREDDGRGTKVHALGWRGELGNTWITSALAMVNVASGVVWTSSGHGYRLGGGTGAELTPQLRQHLVYALRTWGFDDVGA